MKQRITVFGSYATDLMGLTPHLPQPGETVKGSTFRIGAGGKGFNQAVAAKKVDADIVLVSKIARDTFGQFCLDTMNQLAMDTSHMLYSETSGTGAALIMVDEKTGMNKIVIIPGACGEITLDEVEQCATLIRQSGYLLVQFEINMDALERAMQIAQEAGVKIILNPAPYENVPDSLLAMAYAVTPNESEAEGLTGIKVDSEEQAAEAARILHGKGIPNVVITLGGRGVFISDGTSQRMIPAFHVDAVDTTGAGDAFNGGFVAGLAEGMDIWEAGRFASAVAGVSVTRYGTAPSMPTREETSQLLNRQ